MSKYHVHNANVPYVGAPYQGPLMQEIGLSTDYAQFQDLTEAIKCADKLHSACDTGWLVVRTFSERIVYSTVNNEPVVD